MIGEQAAKDPIGNNRRRIHHRKSASDTLAFAASAFFNELPSPMPQPFAVASMAGPAPNRSTEDGGVERPPYYTFRTGFSPSDILEVLKDMDEEELEFDVDNLCVDDLDVEGEEDVAVRDVGDADPDADADVDLDADVPGFPSHTVATAEVEATLGLAAAAAPAGPATAVLGAAIEAMEQHQPLLSRQPRQQEPQQDPQLCCSAPDTRLGSSPCGGGGGSGYVSGGSNGRRRPSGTSTGVSGAPSAAPGVGAARSSRHMRHPSDPSAWAAAPLLVDKPLSEFAGQTRANALDPSQLDPKRAKRIIANRQSAHRSRMKKLQVINDLEQQVTAARSATDTSRQQVAAAADRRRELLLAALEAHFRLEGLRREVGTARAVQVALVSELQSLGTVTAQGERVSQEHHAHAHAQVQGHRHGNQLTMTAPGAAAVTAVAEPWGRSSVSGGHASGVDAAEAAMVDGDVLVVEDCGLPAAVGTGDVCTPSLPEAIQPAGSGRQLGVSAAGTLASTATTLSTAVVGASVAGTAVVPDVLFSDGNAPPPSPASAGPHLASVAQQPPSSTGRSETAVTSAPRLVPGLATTCGAGALTRRPESSLPQTRDVNVCTGNPGSTIAPGCSAAGGEGGGGGGGTHLLIGTGICTGVKKELQEQQQQQQQRHLAATAVVAAPGLQPLIPGGYFRGAHPHPSNGMATLPSASRPAHAAAAAATGTSNAADAPAVSSTGVMQVLPHLPTGLSTGPSVSASFAMAFTSPPNSAVQPPMPVPLPYGAAAVDAPPPSHLLFEPPQVPLLLQGGPQGFLHHPPPPPHGARVPSRPIHRRHFSAGCAIELSGRPPVHVCRGGEPSCAGEVLLSTAPSFAPVASLPSAAPFPVVVPACHSRTRSTTTLTAAASSIITSINPAHKTTPTIPISTSASAIAADTDVVSGGDTDAADALQLRMRLSASSSHGPALPVFAAPASGAGPGPCYRPRSSNAGLVGAYEVPTTLAPTAVADGSGSGSGMEIEGRGQGGPGSPMALDQMGPDSLMPDLPSVEDFLLKEAEGTGVGSTEAEGGMA